MTETEQERIIGADFKAKRDAERKLACLQSKKAMAKKNVEATLGILDGQGVLDSITENTLHIHDGKAIDRKHKAITFPAANDVFELMKEIEATEREIAEIDQRLAKI